MSASTRPSRPTETVAWYLRTVEEPGPYHLPYEVADRADAIHGGLWRIANRLIPASKATVNPPESQWTGLTFDEDRVLE